MRWGSEMAEHVIRLPDVGEGVAEAELVEWHVKIGDLVREDAVLAAVMTDKATVEIPSPVEGEIVWLGAEIGDVVAVGSDLVRLKVRRRRTVAPTDETERRRGEGSRREDGSDSVRRRRLALAIRQEPRPAATAGRVSHERASTNRSAATVRPWSSSSRRREAHRRTGCSSQGARGGS